MKNTITFSLFTFTFSLALCATAAGAKHIDFEHHYISTNYFNFCATRAAKQQEPWYDAEAKVMHFWYGDYDYSQCNYSANTLYTDLTDLGEKRIAEMDRAGIDVAVLSSAATLEELPAEDAVALARKSNNDLYNAIKANPDRFMGAALLPTMQVPASCTELERCVKELGFKYWYVGSTFLGPDGNTRHIWESEFEPIIAKAWELGVCIYLHPDYAPESDYWDIGSFAYGGPGMAFGLDVMQTVTHLVMNGTFDKYPNLRIILGHMGEYLPYVLDRMNYHQNLYLENGSMPDPTNMQCKETLYHYVVTNANFVISTSGATDTNAFLCAKEALGADRIVFASDWPYESITNATKFIDTCELTDAEKDGVWSDNAAMYILHETTPISGDILSIEHVTYSLWQRDTDKDEWREVKFNTVSNRYEVLSNAQAKIVYEAELGYHFADNSLSVTRVLDTTVSPVTGVPGQDPLPEVVEGTRPPDYASDDGYDWLFNHAIKGKQYENEAFADNGVDIFYVYPTLMTNVNPPLEYVGFRLIDDPEMRDMSSVAWTNSVTSAYDAFWRNGRCFADLGYVYAPFYRQATIGHMNEQGNYFNLTNMLYHGYGYLDITNALETYFTKWNTNKDGSRRKFILAGHSQGSGTLMLAMEHYFAQDDTHKAYLKNLVASYQIGFGVNNEWITNLEKNTKTEGFDGVKFASNATGTCVVVSYNTTGEGGSGQSIVLPDSPLVINPISWTRDATRANRELNLGSLTNVNPDAIAYGLHSASNNLTRGTVESDGFTDADWSAGSFGTKSLHNHDCRIFWEDLHKNAYDRITAATDKEPIVGQPTDYEDSENWMRLGDAEKTRTTEKPFDVFYLYPTSAFSSDYVGEIDDTMKQWAAFQYDQDIKPLETYANMYAPYYRQLSISSLYADPSPDGTQLNCARHVIKTDTFAALDYYFETINPEGARPFVLVSHSQGSACMKNILEQYFVGKKAAWRAKMIAAYMVGYTISTDWCSKFGYTFATGATDTNVVLTFNTEGPDAPGCSNFFTADPHGQAINPLNWKTDATYAPITENLGSFDAKTGKLIAGGADAQLDPVNHPGALIVTNTVFGSDYTGPEEMFGKDSYHLYEFGMFRENVCDNILERGKDMTGYAKLSMTNLPEHVRVMGVQAAGADLTAVGGGYWATTSAGSVATTVTPTNENPAVVFANGEREISLAMKCEGGAWVTAMSDAEIAAATKTGDTPKVMLGVVAQRYPWNGMLDIQYKTLFANGSRMVTFYADGLKLGTAQGTGGKPATANFDLNAIDAFKDKKLKGIRITATIE